MEATTNTTRTLKIDGMTGDACVKKVTAALRDVPGVSTQSVTVGSATFKGDEAACDAACSAIDAAGYTSHSETGASKDATGGGQKSQNQYKDGGQTGSPAQKSMGDTAGVGASGSGTASGGQGGSNQGGSGQAGSNQGGSSQGGNKGTDRPGVTIPAKPSLTSH